MLPKTIKQYTGRYANGGLFEETRQLVLMNKCAIAGNLDHEGCTNYFFNKAPMPLPLDLDSFFNTSNPCILINMGFAYAKHNLNILSPHGELFETLTAGKEPDFSLTFKVVFEGNVDLNLIDTRVKYFVYFRLHQFGKQLHLEVYSSIDLGSQNQAMPLFDHQIRTLKDNRHSQLYLSGKFLWDGRLYQLNTCFHLTTAIEMALGLIFKTIEFEIKNDRQTIISEGELYQSIGNRLKSLYNSKLSSSQNGHWGIRKKISMLKNLLNYGI